LCTETSNARQQSWWHRGLGNALYEFTIQHTRAAAGVHHSAIEQHYKSDIRQYNLLVDKLRYSYGESSQARPQPCWRGDLAMTFMNVQFNTPARSLVLIMPQLSNIINMI
jgi:uncharacterized protein YukE